MSDRKTIAAVVAACLIAGACGQHGGDEAGVRLAALDGRPITAIDLAAERNGATPSPTEPSAADRAALQQMINRKLLAKDADGIDFKSDSASAARRDRLMESAKASVIAAKLGAAAPAPSPDEIDAFIAAHPEAFKDRKFLILDQIQFKNPGSNLSLTAASAAKSMDLVQQTIVAAKIPFQRGLSIIDTTGAPPAVVKQLLALSPGEIYQILSGPNVVEGQIVQIRQIPLAGPAAAEIAGQMLRNERGQAIVQQRLAALRKAAKIQYDVPAYAPKAG
jgi:hypothetical protein